MKKGKLVKRPMVSVPQSLDEAAEFVRRIGEARREIDLVNLSLNQRVEMLKAETALIARPHERKIVGLIEGLFAFAESRRNELTEGGKKKSVELTAGTIAWRFTPPAVMLHDVPSVLKELKRRKLDRFIRVKEEVDKEALLREQETAERVPGVTITKREEFVIKCAELEVEIASDAKKLKKAVA